MTKSKTVTVIGAGLAGSEAAWQLASRGVPVHLLEMRPELMTPAHQSDCFAELVCSNSLGSCLQDRATGLLQAELRRLGSLIMEVADTARVPAGGALAVDREGFAAAVTERLQAHPLVTVVRREAREIPSGLTILCTGPLTSRRLTEAIRGLSGEEQLSFYDAMAPIVTLESVDMDIVYRASRYGRGESDEGDYLNCPMNREQYASFREELIGAETAPLRDFEKEDKRFFEACLPVEELAKRNEKALAFGPLRPVGLDDPRTGRRPHAVVQLRQDNLAGTLYNLVGFQTNLKWGEQKRVFRLIPGLEHAEFVRYGQLHRNTFVRAPSLLEATLQTRVRPDVLIAGQLAGVEGYIGNAGSGLLAGLNAARLCQEKCPVTLPRETMLGALLWYISHAEARSFQPMKANFGLMPPLPPGPKRKKRDRARAHAERALHSLEELVSELSL